MIELAVRNDFPEIQRLLETAFKKPFTLLEYWDWRYFKNPISESRVYVYRDDGYGIVGIRVLSGFEYNVKGDKAILHMSTMGIVSPNFRRKGIYTKLIKHSAAEVEKTNRDFFIYVFPNEKSVQAIKRVPNYCFINNLKLWVYSINPFRTVSTRITKPKDEWLTQKTKSSSIVLNGIQISRVHSFSGISLNSDECLIIANSCSVSRSEDYLNWRYCLNPSNKYEIYVAQKGGDNLGYIVVKREVRYGFNSFLIVDLIGKDNDVIGSLIKFTKEIAKQEKADFIGILTGDYLPYKRTLSNQGFLCIPKQFTPKKFYIMGYPQNPNSENELARRIHSVPWYFTWGETDVV